MSKYLSAADMTKINQIKEQLEALQRKMFPIEPGPSKTKPGH